MKPVRFRARWHALLLICTLCATLVPASHAASTEPMPPLDADARREAGWPFMHNFEPDDYGGYPQNWAIVEDHQGVIYVGNNQSGVLAFDGSHWRAIALSNNSGARSLASDGNGRIYVGGIGEIGYLAPDAFGEMGYVSLLEKVATEDRDFTLVMAVRATDHGVYFLSSTHLFRWHDERISVWKPQASFRSSFWVSGKFYVRDSERGLLQMVDDLLLPLAGGERFAEEKPVALIPWGDASDSIGERLLIPTVTQGWLMFDGADYRPWPTSADAALTRDLMSTAIKLDDGTLAVATSQGGVSLLDENGRLLRRLSKANGLANDVVYALYQDSQRGLWLGLESGVARLDLGSPVTRYNDLSGLKGMVLALERFEGTLYAATSRGVFRLQTDGDEGSNFEPVAAIPPMQVWALLPHEGALLVAGGKGVFEIRGDSVSQIMVTETAATELMRSKRDPTRIYVGLRVGVALLRSQDGRWLDEGTVPGLGDEVRSFFEEPDGTVWTGNGSGGATRFRLPSSWSANLDQKTPIEVQRFGSDHGLPLGYTNVFPIDGKLRLAGKKGTILQFAETQNRFVADPDFAALFPEGEREIWVAEQTVGKPIWIFTTDVARGFRELGTASRAADGSFDWRPTPLGPVSDSSVFAMHADADGVMWFGGDQGLFRYDPRSSVPGKKEISARIHRVTDRQGRVLYGGSSAAVAPSIEYADNALRIEFSNPSYDMLKANRFQYFLEGLDNDWSPWSHEAYRDFNNIGAGDYRFRVRARNAYGLIGPEADFPFRILRPWFRSGWAYLGYVLALLGLAWAFLRWRVRRLENEKRGLQAVLDERARLSRELHDKLSQTMTGIVLQLEAARSAAAGADSSAAGMPHIERASSLARDAINETRRTLRGLGPAELTEQLGLAEVLRRNLDRLTAGTATRIEVRSLGAQVSLTPEVELELYRIGQEAATNALRHGGATEIDVTLSFESGGIRLRLCDNGRGFAGDIAVQDTGLGLAGMRERVQRLRGELSIQSQPERGTDVEVYVPSPAPARV